MSGKGHTCMDRDRPCSVLTPLFLIVYSSTFMKWGIGMLGNLSVYLPAGCPQHASLECERIWCAYLQHVHETIWLYIYLDDSHDKSIWNVRDLDDELTFKNCPWGVRIWDVRQLDCMFTWKTNHDDIVWNVRELDNFLTLRTSMRWGSGMSGNLMVQVGLVMACSLAMLFLMCWKGVLPYTMLYRMHPSDHTSLRTPTYTKQLWNMQQTGISASAWQHLIRNRYLDHYFNASMKLEPKVRDWTLCMCTSATCAQLILCYCTL